jgi:ubiquinone/menaquinone biosynthesis C-methylase UbiE
MGTTPDYDAAQSSFHEAFRPELFRILDSLPLPPGGNVLDVPCGNGFYAQRLAERAACGRLVAVDANDEYLRQTRERLGEKATAQKVDAYQLPFADTEFDLVWSAQSLITLDPGPAVREMFRVVKPGGTLAILEGDVFHNVLLSWPVELEAALPKAIQTESVRQYGDAAKLAPARRLRRILKECGFHPIRRSTHSFDRAAPFDAITASFLGHHFDQLRAFAYPHLSAANQASFDRLTNPDDPVSFLRRADAEFACLNAVYVARRPAQAGGDLPRASSRSITTAS